MTDRSSGRLAWHELLTPDAAAGYDFYTRVMGWKTQPWEHNPSYIMFVAPGAGPVGAVVSEDGSAYWRHYIAVDDVDVAVSRAIGLGGSVAIEPTALPEGSRYAVLTDPQGAIFAVFQAATGNVPDGQPDVGHFSWLELAAVDARAALAFYEQLFGWQITAEHDMGPLGFYFLFGVGGRDIGGAFNKPADMPGPPSWLGYVRVRNMVGTVDKAKAAGAQLINGPMEVPGGDWIAQFLDPQGGAFAIHVLKSDLQPAAPKPPEGLDLMAEPGVSAPAPVENAPVAKSSSGAGKGAARTKKRAGRPAAGRGKPVRAATKKRSRRNGAIKTKTAQQRSRKAAKVSRGKAPVGTSARKKSAAATKIARKRASARPRKGK